MHSAWCRSTFLRVLKYLQIKEQRPNFRGKATLQKVWIIWPTLLYFNFKSFLDRISLSFIRFQCILNDSENFAESLNYFVPASVLNFKSFEDPNSLSFVRFRCILHNSGVLFSESWNFLKLKSGDLISGGKQFCRKSELFGPPFRISILKVLWSQIDCYSLDFNAFCMIQE